MDPFVGIGSLSAVFVLTGLGMSIRSLYLTSEKMGKNRSMLRELEDSEHMEVHEALDKAKK